MSFQSFSQQIYIGFQLICISIICLTMVSMVSSTEPSVSTTSSVGTGSTVSPAPECHALNSSCEHCVQNSSCYYCYPSKTCDVYPYKTLKPYSKCGQLKDMAFKTCLVDYSTLIIVLSSVGGAVVLISIICCCCLCRKVRRAQIRRQLQKWEQKRSDQKVAQEERRAQREQRRQELRNKYGLGDKANTYSRFD